MRQLGLIGGMSWVSTQAYYEQINRIVQKRAGAKSSAPIFIDSINFADVMRAQTEEEWERTTGILITSAKRLEAAGAGMIAICANSMHRVHREVEAEVSVPILHIAECVGRRMKQDEVKTAALLGPRNVMTESFYRRRLVAHGVDLLPPEMDNVDLLDRIIYDELVQGRATRDAERRLRSIITEKEQDGAEAIVLAATELEQVVDIDANVLPIYDSTRIHAQDCADWILGED